MLECFEDIIGLKGTCDTPVSNSGLWINDVGVSLEELDLIVSKEYSNAQDFFEQKRDFAIKQIIATIHTHFADKYKANSTLRSGRIGFTKENKPAIAGSAGKYKGIELELCNQDSFVDVFISSISLQVNTAGAVNVLVYDLFQGKLLDTIAITAVSGEVVTVYPNKTYKSNRKELDLAFVYDSTGISSVETKITRTGCNSCGDGSSMVNLNQYLSTRSVLIDAADPKTNENLEAVGDTGGLSIMYTLQCNHEDWLCTVSNSIALPILYKTAAEIMEFAVHASKRLNTSTTLDVEKLTERRDLYETRYKDTMENLIQNIKLPQDEKCFECRQKSKHVVILP